MPSIDSAPFVYVLIGIILLLVCLLWWNARRGRKRSKAFTVNIIQVLPRPISKSQSLWETLTAREKEVARLVADGARNADVARALYITPHTVNSHLKSIYRKMHVNSRTELAQVIRDCVD